jgi:hypothetical protein
MARMVAGTNHDDGASVDDDIHPAASRQASDAIGETLRREIDTDRRRQDGRALDGARALRRHPPRKLDPAVAPVTTGLGALEGRDFGKLIVRVDAYVDARGSETEASRRIATKERTDMESARCAEP